MNTIEKFTGKYDFLSNFYLASIIYRGQIWHSTEHLYQGFKATNVHDRERIRNCDTPSKAKHLGKIIQIRSDWNFIKEKVMLQIVKMKFNQNQHLIDLLIKSHPAQITEGNVWHDNFWGNCMCPKCENIHGQNKLGNILMAVRSIYINDFEHEFFKNNVELIDV